MEMNADMTQHPVLITEPANVDKKQREKMVEVTTWIMGILVTPRYKVCQYKNGILICFLLTD